MTSGPIESVSTQAHGEKEFIAHKWIIYNHKTVKESEKASSDSDNERLAVHINTV